ncbi:NAD(P)H-dependent oxidoreductase [Edwardsiella piscicida]|nr:NAD(P)H-dependent oxidoreductase [Edwardsiella piscicida]
MSHILLLNGMKPFGHSNGQLNTTLHDTARERLGELGHQLRTTTIDQGYQVAQEVENILWADCIIYQMPGWWMGEPWIVKNTLMRSLPPAMAVCTPTMGVPAPTPAKIWLRRTAAGQKYMLSLTWNAPQEAFDDPAQFFHGQGSTASTCTFTRLTSSSVWRPCRPSCAPTSSSVQTSSTTWRAIVST